MPKPRSPEGKLGLVLAKRFLAAFEGAPPASAETKDADQEICEGIVYAAIEEFKYSLAYAKTAVFDSLAEKGSKQLLESWGRKDIADRVNIADITQQVRILNRASANAKTDRGVLEFESWPVVDQAADILASPSKWNPRRYHNVMMAACLFTARRPVEVVLHRFSPDEADGEKIVIHGLAKRTASDAVQTDAEGYVVNDQPDFSFPIIRHPRVSRYRVLEALDWLHGLTTGAHRHRAITFQTIREETSRRVKHAFPRISKAHKKLRDSDISLYTLRKLAAAHIFANQCAGEDFLLCIARLFDHRDSIGEDRNTAAHYALFKAVNAPEPAAGEVQVSAAPAGDPFPEFPVGPEVAGAPVAQPADIADGANSDAGEPQPAAAKRAREEEAEAEDAHPAKRPFAAQVEALLGVHRQGLLSADLLRQAIADLCE